MLALIVYTLLWTLYGTIAKASQGLHTDMVEIVAWSRDLAWGYKHPPVSAALVWLWFHIFPVADWSYYLLAMLMPALTLWIVWRGSADYFDVEKRIAGVALLTFVPFFNFHALKFNANTILLPLWAVTAFWFLRSYTRRSVLYALLAGFAAAGSMLGKYWSVFLIAGLVVAALIDRRRGAYFRSAAPWITAISGALLLAPHIVWLFRNDFEPFRYAAEAHGDNSFAGAAVSVIGYLAGSFGYVAVPVIIVLAMARPRAATLADMVWPADGNHRLAAAAFWAPLLLPAVAALASGIAITSLWSMSCWALLPLLLLSPPTIRIARIDTGRILVGALVLPLVMLIAAPGIAIVAQRQGPLPASAQARLLAIQIEGAWHAITPQPLRFVGGPADLAFAVAAYAADRPRALPDLPQPSRAELAQHGLVWVCFAEDAGCRRDAVAGAARIGPSRGIETTITRDFLALPVARSAMR